MPLDFQRNKGFTLTEAAIVLGVVGVVLAGVWTGASAVYKKMRIERGIQQATVIVQNMRTLYANRGQFSHAIDTNADITAAMVRSGVFPKETFDSSSSTTPKTPWGTNYTIWASTGKGTDTFMLTFNLSGQPQYACAGLLDALASGAYAVCKKVSTSTTSSDWIDVKGNMDTLTPEYFKDCTDVRLVYKLKGQEP